jgi:hypothetical protein
VRVTWENDRGSGGVALGTTSWSIPNLQLAAGVNLLTVTAEDANGNRATDSLTVTATLPDTTAPVVTITGPKPEAQFSTEAATITVSGSAADNTQVTAVSWTDSHGQSGGATLSGQTWSIAGLALEIGPNVITVMASDAAGNAGADVATVVRLPADAAAPAIAIVFPTAAAEFATGQATLNLSGEASDDRGIQRITWSNHRGGSGLVTGTALWAVNGIPLQPGLNSVTLTAEDEAGNQAQDNVAVTYTPPDADGDGIADAWELQSFGSLATASASSDTGSTGVSDFLKYAFCLDPAQPSAPLLPQASAEAEGPGSYLTLRYRQLMVPGTLSYRVGVSGDLVAWDYSESLIEQIGLPVPTGDGVTEEVTVRLATPVEVLPRAYLRVKVSEGP